MARPRSEDKQLALLEAAAEIVASQGLAAPTSAIAKRAGVAEGTLFRYFATKDDLLNELYLHIKRSLGESMQAKRRQATPLQKQVRSLWDGYINWGIANPAAIKTLSQLYVSDKITANTRSKVSRLFPEIQQISESSISQGVFSTVPRDFADAVFVALADTAMQSAVQDPARADKYKTIGFTLFWKGLTS